MKCVQPFDQVPAPIVVAEPAGVDAIERDLARGRLVGEEVRLAPIRERREVGPPFVPLSRPDAGGAVAGRVELVDVDAPVPGL